MTTAKQMRQQFVKEQQPMNREDILKAATQAVCNDREQTHGDAAVTFESVATLWSVTFGIPVEAWQVSIAMQQLKQVRVIGGDYTEPDHWTDICGYASLGAEIAGKA